MERCHDVLCAGAVDGSEAAATGVARAMVSAKAVGLLADIR
jgi:hypothetical protein